MFKYINNISNFTSSVLFFSSVSCVSVPDVSGILFSLLISPLSHLHERCPLHTLHHSFPLLLQLFLLPLMWPPFLPLYAQAVTPHPFPDAPPLDALHLFRTSPSRPSASAVAVFDAVTCDEWFSAPSSLVSSSSPLDITFRISVLFVSYTRVCCLLF